MIKSRKIVEELRTTVKQVSDNPIQRVIRKYGDINGREEDLTSKLEDRLGEDLVTEMKNKLGDKKMDGISFNVLTYKKKEEKFNGADILGIYELNANGVKISKAYLAQCKVGKISKGKIHFYCSSSKNVITQAKKMLNITSDSFFFIYTNKGVFSVPAFQIVLANKTKSINGKNVFYKRIDTFYVDLFKCFIGDHKISNKFQETRQIEQLIENNQFNELFDISIKNILYIGASED